MRRTSPDLRSGEIEVDETFVGTPRPGKVGRDALNKQIVIIRLGNDRLTALSWPKLRFKELVRSRQAA
jgi:hypothetical protein